jgi:hypothetical protein
LTRGATCHDEIGGIYIVSPWPNSEHQRLGCLSTKVFAGIVEGAGLGIVFHGINLSDREIG